MSSTSDHESVSSLDDEKDIRAPKQPKYDDMLDIKKEKPLHQPHIFAPVPQMPTLKIGSFTSFLLVKSNGCSDVDLSFGCSCFKKPDVDSENASDL
jgi:hypothetical protein